MTALTDQPMKDSAMQVLVLICFNSSPISFSHYFCGQFEDFLCTETSRECRSDWLFWKQLKQSQDSIFCNGQSECLVDGDGDGGGSVWL